MEELGLEAEPVSAGWGYRPSGRSAVRNSRRSGGRLLVLEDALVRSMKPGAGQVYGLVADSRGIYYDAAGNSDLVATLASGERTGWMRPNPADAVDVEFLMSRFRSARASKYNWYPGDFRGPVPQETGVLVVDQTRGDASLSHGGLAETDFDRMVRDALDEHPSSVIYLRAHPDHRYRAKHSCFPAWVYQEPRVKLLSPDLSPATCFGFCTEVYAGTSLMGMEALIHGRRVKTYGWNFYAGWGLTEDRCRSAVAPRGRSVDLARLFEAAYLQYCHYFDPDSGEPCGLDRILDHLELQQSVASQNAGTKVTVGWTPWSRGLSADFFRSPGTDLLHADSVPDAMKLTSGKEEAKLLMWGGNAVEPACEMPVIRVEDGFLRSSGLGADFHRPLSWVMDDQGIYFDPRTPSRLEQILESAVFTEEEMSDAGELLAFLRRHRLTKYNVGGNSVNWKRSEAKGRKVILVPGQVEKDASIRCGSPNLRSNGALLAEVRKAEPAAFLIFKAHPDLVAGARHGSVLPDSVESLADLVVVDGHALDWLDLCDEVHTMTSTLGFESILRGVPVVTYGLPFYAGWGLTRDHLACPRRTRILSVGELVCGAMIRYPRYLNPVSGEFTTAIQVARLLVRSGKDRENREWYLRGASLLKHTWVRLARQRGH